MEISHHLPIDGNKVLIIGNWSYKNMGDELILLGTINLLMAQKKEIFVAAYDCSRLKHFLAQFVDIKNITFLPEIPKGPRSLIKLFKTGEYKLISRYFEVDSIIIGGGEILTEENPNSYRYWLISLLPCLIKKINKPVNIYLMGGIQIPDKMVNRGLFNFLLKQTKHIFVRDFEGEKDIKDYGFSRVSFFMDTSYFAYPWQATEIKNNTVIVNINKNGEHFLEQIVADVKQAISEGSKILYVSVSKGHQSEYDDMKYFHQLKEIFGNKIEILDREKDFRLFAKTLSESSLVISTRLHLFLISSFLGCTTKVYPYQKKILKMQNVIGKIF